MIKRLSISLVLVGLFCSSVFSAQNTTKWVNKFGQAPGGVETTATDIWPLSEGTPTQQIYVAPTEARLHNIISTSANDDGSPVGTGARTVRIWGLKTWSDFETSEDVTMDGTSSVATANSYVFINRMKVLTNGTTSINVGELSATAQTDGSISAVIAVNKGQTQQAIYAIPSTQNFHVKCFYGDINKSQGAAATIIYEIMANESPDVSELNVNFIGKMTRGVQSTGSSSKDWPQDPPIIIPGPAIIKMQGTASTGDVEGSAGFSGVLVSNDN